MKVYVEAKSKAALIRRLTTGEEISGYNYSIFGGGGHYMLDDTLEDGTIIAIYSQMSQGSPVAKSWGTWTNGVLKAETFEARTGGKPLLKRQEKLLEQYIQNGGDAHYYDRLPASLQEELKNIKFHESLHQAVDRWLSSNRPTRFSRWGAETFEAFDPADAWDNHIHQEEMALEAYQEYLDDSGEEPLMTLEEWLEWQADLEDEHLEQQWKDMEEEDEPSPEDDPEYTTLEGTLDSETFEAPKTMTPTQAKKKFVSLLKPYWVRTIKPYAQDTDAFEEDLEVYDEWLRIAKAGKVGQWDMETGDTAVREYMPESFYYLQLFDIKDYDTWENAAYDYDDELPKSLQKQLKALLPAIKGGVAKPKPKARKKPTKKTTTRKAKAPAKKAKPKARKTTRKKKTGRKAPTLSATKRKIGTRMRGNDGKMWQVKKSGKSQRWMAGAETFESPVSCKICGKTFDSFRGLNGHMNAHLPSHRKRAETFEVDSSLENAHIRTRDYTTREMREFVHERCSECEKSVPGVDGTNYFVCDACYDKKAAETFEAEEPSIVRGTWMGGVVEFSNGDVFVKVITFPVTDDSGFGGESMWVILEEGNEFDGIGILDNDPVHSEIKSGSRIKFAGGTPDYKPHFVAVVEAETFEAELSEQLPYEIITTDWKSSIAPEHRHNNDNWFITGDIIFAVPDSEGNYGRGEETIVRISTYGEGTTLDEAKENGIFRATEYLYDDYSLCKSGWFWHRNAETFESETKSDGKEYEYFDDFSDLKGYTKGPWYSHPMIGMNIGGIRGGEESRERVGASDQDLRLLLSAPELFEELKACKETKKSETFEAEGDEPTIEEFFRDMETTLDKYGAWTWDSEARDGDLHISR